ncbi:MAG: arylesterase, partial [Dechloromonas sp.]
TTAGGRTRLQPALKTHRPAVVIIALGANDGLRGLAIGQMQSNLETMIEAAQKTGARVLLAGMRLPPNYGPYAEQFHTAYSDISRRKKIALLPFLLEPVASRPELFLPDNLHPTAAAQPLILEHVWAALAPLLK